MAEKSLEEIKTDILHRAGRINPFERVAREDVEQVVANLNSLEPDLWGSEWGKLGAKYEALAEEQEKTGKQAQAGEHTTWRTSIIVSAVIRFRAARKSWPVIGARCDRF